MKENRAYLEIAIRYIKSCEKHLKNKSNIQEVIAFEAYHAFESLACAYNAHYGKKIPGSHKSKLNAFAVNCKYNKHLNAYEIARLTIELCSLRNRFLYPEKIGRNFKNPLEQISITDTRDLVKRVKGILKQIEKIIYTDER